MTRRADWLIYFALALALQATGAWALLRDRPPAREGAPPAYLAGDSGVYALAAVSLLEDGDLDLLNQLADGSPTPAEYLGRFPPEYAGEFALGSRGELTPRQSPVFALAALPAVALFGLPGCWLFNVAVLNALLVRVALSVGGRVGLVTALGLLAGTPLLRSACNFSPDLLLTLLLLEAFAAATRPDSPPTRRAALTGLWLGVACAVKVYVAAFAFPVALLALWVARPNFWRPLGVLVAAGLLGLVPLLACQYAQFGSPLVSGYEREILLVNGEFQTATHSGRFNQPFGFGLVRLLLDADIGLATQSPAAAFAPVALGWILLSGRARPGEGARAVALAAVVALNLVLLAPYDGWHGGSGFGNRYVFPALACCAVLIGRACSFAWRGRAGAGVAA